MDFTLGLLSIAQWDARCPLQWNLREIWVRIESQLRFAKEVMLAHMVQG